MPGRSPHAAFLRPPGVEKINAAVNKVIAMPEVKERLNKHGIESGYLSVDGFKKLFLSDHELITRIVKESGITRES